MKLTFVDTSVLIAAAVGTDEISRLALEVLDDPERSFASSEFIRLETLPKATFNRRGAERQFYTAFFDAVAKWAEVDKALVRTALDEACNIGSSAMDALHLAAIHQVKADEMVTAEKSTKPLLRSKLVRVVTMRQD